MHTYSKTTACAFLIYLVTASVQATGASLAALPKIFALGLKSSPVTQSWMPASGVPWNYRYQYLNAGWENWNSPAGQIVTNYIQYSRSKGYIAVFDWYLAGSQMNGSTSKLFSNLATPSYMKAYLTSFTLMLKKAGAFTNPVMVHIEPDMWSFMQQQRSQDPTKIPVSVASSGFSGVGGFANNASGLAKALVALRNTYAPNVLLAWDNSTWAVNYDPTCYNRCWGSAATYGSYVASFYKKLAAPFDMIFFHTSDRDSGYKTTVLRQPSGQAWWSATAFSNFRQYIASIYQATGRKSMLWQTPIGNTLYRTVNNTNGHYQDNRPEFFLKSGNRQHIVDFVSAGVIGVLFGEGLEKAAATNFTTSYWDQRGDGITSPTAINGNTLSSTYSDDDGGFLRARAAAYYSSGPVPVQ